MVSIGTILVGLGGFLAYNETQVQISVYVGLLLAIFSWYRLTYNDKLKGEIYARIGFFLLIINFLVYMQACGYFGNFQDAFLGYDLKEGLIQKINRPSLGQKMD